MTTSHSASAKTPDGASRCAAAQALFLDSQLVSLAVNNVAQFILTLANQKKAPEGSMAFHGEISVVP